MPEPIAKLLPTVILVAILGYLTWPYLEEPVAKNGATAKLPEVTAEILSPTPPPDTARDPFGDSVRFEFDDSSEGTGQRGKHEKTTGAKGATGKTTKPNTPAKGGTPGPAKPAPNTTAGPTAPNKTPTVKTSMVETVPDFVLSATVVSGPHRMAIINGRAYAPGDKLESESSAPIYRVAEIHHHLVVLNHDGQMVNLKYPDKPSNSGNAGQARPGAPAAPGGPVKGGAKRPWGVPAGKA